MCLAIYKPAHVQIERKYLERGARINSDGMGLVARTPEGMLRYRTLKDFETFYTVFKANEDYPMMIHFRWATAGRVIEENVHPFHIKGDLFMCHNGGFSDRDSSNYKSDTRLIAEKLSKITGIENVLRDQRSLVFRKVEDIIGYQKVIMMDKDFHHIFNMKYGKHKYGCWWSNEGAFTGYDAVGDYEDLFSPQLALGAGYCSVGSQSMD